MSFFFEILVRIASYEPQIDQSHGENRLSHIIMFNMLYKVVLTFESEEVCNPKV